MAENTRPSRKRSRGPLSSGDNLSPLSRRSIGPIPANDGQENISLARARFSQPRIPSILARDQVAHPRPSPLSTRRRLSPSPPVIRPRPHPTINITRQSLRPRPIPKRRFFGDDSPATAKRRNLQR